MRSWEAEDTDELKGSLAHFGDLLPALNAGQI
jgi:hypothetical protein